MVVHIRGPFFDSEFHFSIFRVVGAPEFSLGLSDKLALADRLRVRVRARVFS